MTATEFQGELLMRISKPGRMLLGGAYILAGLIAWGQNPSEPAQKSLDLAILYTPLLTNVVSADRFTMQGGTVQLHGQFFHGLGALADIAVEHTSNTGGGGVGLDLVTTTFGARYTWWPSRSRTSLFGQAALGEAFGLNSVFPGSPSARSKADSMAYQVGGGFNIHFSPYVSLRAFDAAWLRTQLPNSTTNVQNSLRIGAGVVMRFH
jgi:hypothetical protein